MLVLCGGYSPILSRADRKASETTGLARFPGGDCLGRAQPLALLGTVFGELGSFLLSGFDL
jgi:hypothetical protein